jgi:UDP-N-acetylglucosamine 2-epimerase (hydrolysing)
MGVRQPVMKTSTAVTRRKILFVTGTRADFGKIKPLIQQVRDSQDFEYNIFVTGMHMLSLYGLTVNEIRKAGFENIYSYINQDSAITSNMDLVLANTIQGFGYYVREVRPDLIVVHGDRVEALAGAVVGALNNILVAHIEGGELSGTVDELLRHAITKLSQIHFVSHNEARNRLIQMGETPETVFVIGSPDIDIMLSKDLPSISEVKKKYAIPFKEYGIFTYHPVTTELDKLEDHITQVMEAVVASAMNYVVLYPNNDAGADVIIRHISQLEGNSRVRIIPSMRFEYFLALLKNARVMVGNSSAGIREAPVYGVPTVNIGTRQLNRFHYDSIINVPAERAKILKVLHDLPRSVKPSLHFGRGESASLFMAQLRQASFWQTSPQKQFQDMPDLDPLIISRNRKENDQS